MWKNSLKNAESDKNKILYETLFDFFYSETVLTVLISLANIEECTNVMWAFLDAIYSLRRSLFIYLFITVIPLKA